MNKKTDTSYLWGISFLLGNVLQNVFFESDSSL